MNVIYRFIILAISLVSLSVQAASLGALTPQSKFGQPLVAHVEVLLDGLPIEEYQAVLASPAVHSTAEVDFTGFHQGVTTEIVPVGDSFAVRLSTSEKLKEPVFDFVLELKWRGGRVQRLYTLLPEFISTTASSNTLAITPSVAPQREEKTPTRVSSRTSPSAPLATVSQDSASISPVSAGTYLVKTGDSLWLIASRMSSGYGTLAQRIDLLMMANLELIKSNTPMGIHPGDGLTIPEIGETVVPVNILTFSSSRDNTEQTVEEPFYRQADAKAALLARVRGRQLVRLAAQAGRFIEPAVVSTGAQIPSAERVQQRVDELNRRDVDLENRLAVLDEKIERVLADEPEPVKVTPVVPVQAPAEVPVASSSVDTESRSWVWWIIIPVLLLLIIGLAVSVWLFIQRRREVEQEAIADSDYWEQEPLSEYRSVDRETSGFSSEDPDFDETNVVSDRVESGEEAVDADLAFDDIAIIEPETSTGRFKVKDPDFDELDALDIVSKQEKKAPANEAMTGINDSAADATEEESGEDIEFTFTEVHQKLDAKLPDSEADRIPVTTDELEEDALDFELPEIIVSDETPVSEDYEKDPQDDEVEIDAWPTWDKISAVDLVDEKRDEFDLAFDVDKPKNASDSFDDELSDFDPSSAGDNGSSPSNLNILESTTAFEETVQLDAPVVSVAEDVAVAESIQTEADTAVEAQQDMVEPLKRMLLAGPQRQPKVKSAASSVSSPFESMLFDEQNGTNRALFYIEINELDDIENRIGPLDAEQVAQHLGVKIRDYVGLQGQNDELMRLRDSTYLYVGDYKQEAELTEYGEAIAQMVSGSEFLSGGVDVGLTVSIGIVPIGPHFDSVNEYLICAKKTVDEARQLAQDGIEVPQVALFSAPVDMLEQDEALISKVTEYIRDEQFDIVFQPLINLTGECEHLFSAKAEIGHDVDLTKLPDHFLASAFSSSASVALDKYAIRQSLEQIIHLHSQLQEAVILVRVSNNSIHDPAFITWLKKLVVGHEHYAKQVVLCLDEHLIAGQRVACWSFCNSLKSSGYQIGVNSFGATKDSLDHAMELGARIVRFDNDKVNLAIKTSEGIEHLSRLAVACKERGIETITYTFNSTAIPSIWQFNIDAIRSNYILVPDRSNNFEISGT